MFRLLEPDLTLLPSYQSALRRGWSPDNITDRSAVELAASERDPAAYVAARSDAANMVADGSTVTLPDGTQAPRVPMRDRWIWDGEFCGRIGLRFRPGTNDLFPHILGHIGYAVVPWKRRLGYATRALAAILPEARTLGLTRVTLTCDAGNSPSQKVILANHGVLVERFVAAQYGAQERLLYAIELI